MSSPPNPILAHKSSPGLWRTIWGHHSEGCKTEGLTMGCQANGGCPLRCPGSPSFSTTPTPSQSHGPTPTRCAACLPAHGLGGWRSVLLIPCIDSTHPQTRPSLLGALPAGQLLWSPNPRCCLTGPPAPRSPAPPPPPAAPLGPRPGPAPPPRGTPQPSPAAAP